MKVHEADVANLVQYSTRPQALTTPPWLFESEGCSYTSEYDENYKNWQDLLSHMFIVL